jgi:predicted amidohydrolase YtcJ
MQSEADVRRSMTVENGVITAFDKAGRRVRTVDLGGLHVFPAMTDAHICT